MVNPLTTTFSSSLSLPLSLNLSLLIFCQYISKTKSAVNFLSLFRSNENKTQKNHFGQNPGTPKQKLSGPLSINRYLAHLSPASTSVEATPQTT